MRKIALFFLGLIICLSMGVGAASALLIPYPWSIIVILVALIAAIFLFEQIRKQAQKKWAIKTAIFVVITEVPTIIGSLIAIGIVWYLYNDGYWAAAFLGGLIELVVSASCLICSVIILVSTLIFALIHYLKRK